MLLLLLACSPPPDLDADRRACKAGIAPACAVVGAALPSPGALDLACAGGSVAGCDGALARGSTDRLRLEGLRATIAATPNAALTARARSATSPLRAYADWEAACFKDDGAACAEALRVYRSGALGFYDGARAEGLAALACAAGEASLCPREGGLPSTAGRPEGDATAALAAAEAECAGGWTYGCRVLAQAALAGAQDRGALTRDATWTAALRDAEAATRRACAAGDAYSCVLERGFSCGTDDPAGCLLGS